MFFPLPDGNGLLYNVTGVSEAPKAISNIVRDVPCKTNYTELLTINNWLKKPQRYRYFEQGWVVCGCQDLHTFCSVKYTSSLFDLNEFMACFYTFWYCFLIRGRERCTFHTISLLTNSCMVEFMLVLASIYL